MMQYILDRAKEPSSWRGAVLLLTSLGLSIAPELANAIIGAGVAVAGLLGVVTKGQVLGEKSPLPMQWYQIEKIIQQRAQK